jgi:hypothetical protein
MTDEDLRIELLSVLEESLLEFIEDSEASEE